MFLSVFDLDKTLLKKNSSVEFCKFLYKKNIISLVQVLFSLFYYIRHCCFGLSLEQLHNKSFKKILFGFSLPFLQEQVESFLEKELSNLLYLPALNALYLAKQSGHSTYILSSSPQFLVCAIAQKLQVHNSKSSEYLVDKHGRLCQIAIVLDGEGKSAFVEQFREKNAIAKENVTAYSDSYLDLPFLLSAGSVVVVNPDSRLKRLSKKLGWRQI